ncbi:MAG: COG4223 family protein [Caulobacterales bacterium]
MSAGDRAEGGHAEPIDVEYEPARRGRPRYGGGRRGGVSFGTAAALAVLAAGVGAVGGALAPRSPQIAQALDQIAPGDGVTARQTQAAQMTIAQAQTDLGQRLAKIESYMANPTAETAGVDGAPIVAQVMGVQAALSAVQGRLDALPSNEQIAGLTGEVEQVRAQLPALQERLANAELAAGAAFAVAAADEAARASGAFSESYAALAALLPTNPDVTALAPLAVQGAPSRIELRDRFEAMELDIVRAARQAQAGSGLWGRVQAASANWITVRRRGEGETTAGVLERAHARLVADDLAGAVAEVGRLRGAGAQASAGWLADARRRLEIENHLAAVRAELARRG